MAAAKSNYSMVFSTRNITNLLHMQTGQFRGKIHSNMVNPTKSKLTTAGFTPAVYSRHTALYTLSTRSSHNIIHNSTLWFDGSKNLIL